MKSEALTRDSEPVTPNPRRSRRLYVYWSAALGVLILAALFSWLVVVPMLETRKVVRLLEKNRLSHEEALAQLGGEERAARRLLFHLRHYDRLGEGRKEWEAAVLLLAHCEVPEGEPDFRDREISFYCTVLAEQIEEMKSEAFIARAHWAYSIKQFQKKDPADPRIATGLKRLDKYNETIGELDNTISHYNRWAKWLNPDRK